MKKIPSALIFIKVTIAFVIILTTTYAQENTSIRFYGHPGFDFFSNSKQNSHSAYFRGGPMILYVTSQLSDKVSVAGELNLHYMSTTGAEVELERMYLRYQWKDALSFRVGRMYSPIGFWNMNYNFGLVLQPNISRPRILNPTHDGGFIQTRDIGVQLEGENIGGAFFYKVFISNGIGRNGGLLGTPYALGEKLAYTVQLGVEPVEGLRISVSGVLNQLPAGSLSQFDVPVPQKMTSQLISASISHMSIDKKFEIVAEYFNNTHNYSSLEDKQLNGGILYMGYRAWPKLTPYFFAEFFDFPSNDPYYPSVNVYTGQPYVSSSEFNLGLRFRALSNLVLKGELSLMDQDLYGESIGFKTQVAFGF